MKKVLTLIVVMFALPSMADHQVKLIRTFCSPFSWGNNGIPESKPSCVAVHGHMERHRSGVYMPYMQPMFDDYHPSTELGLGEALGFSFTNFFSYKKQVVQYGGYSFSGAYITSIHGFVWSINLTLMGSAGASGGFQASGATNYSTELSWYFYV